MNNPPRKLFRRRMAAMVYKNSLFIRPYADMNKMLELKNIRVFPVSVRELARVVKRRARGKK